jgi:hypothetical protein
VSSRNYCPQDRTLEYEDMVWLRTEVWLQPGQVILRGTPSDLVNVEVYSIKIEQRQITP